MCAVLVHSTTTQTTLALSEPANLTVTAEVTALAMTAAEVEADQKRIDEAISLLEARGMVCMQ